MANSRRQKTGGGGGVNGGRVGNRDTHKRGKKNVKIVIYLFYEQPVILNNVCFVSLYTLT